MNPASAIITFILGFASAYFVQWITAKRNNRLSEITEYLAEIEKIQAASVEYWLNDSRDESIKEKALSAKLRGVFHATGKLRERSRGLLGNLSEEFIRLDGEIYDCVTGGKFDIAQREPDYQRVVQAMQLCAEMKAVLRDARSAMFWAH
jgi:hypothetical protein